MGFGDSWFETSLSMIWTVLTSHFCFNRLEKERFSTYWFLWY